MIGKKQRPPTFVVNTEDGAPKLKLALNGQGSQEFNGLLTMKNHVGIVLRNALGKED